MKDPCSTSVGPRGGVSLQCSLMDFELVSVSVVGGRLYLFGGVSSPEATECLPGVYSFDIGEEVTAAGARGEALIRVKRGCDDISCSFLTVSLTWDCLATGGVAVKTLRHSSVAVGDNIYVYGGIMGGNRTDDLLVFSTGPELQL